MKKAAKPIRPELRVRIGDNLFRALKVAAARRNHTVPFIVECALASYWMVRGELTEDEK